MWTSRLPPWNLATLPAKELAIKPLYTPTHLSPQPSSETSFRQYATKLGYPDNLITRVLNDLGADAENEDLLSHLINLQDMLCPKDSAIRRRRDATHLPAYMLAQDSCYKGKDAILGVG